MDYKPSKRYINLLVEGAKDHNLDEQWIKQLEAIQSFEVMDPVTKVAKYLFVLPSLALVPIVFLFFGVSKYFKYQSPLLLTTALLVLRTLHFFHNVLYTLVFPSGT